MIHQRYKDLYFLALSQATLPNYWIKKALYAFRSSSRTLHLHVGCGTIYLPGFVNIDANPRQKLDLWLDVRRGLPFRSASVDSIYSTHMIEHLYDNELRRLLQECRRVLKPGGGIRLIVPSLKNAITAYREGRHDWFYDSFPQHFDSLGGRFSNFVFCDGQHRTAFDFDYLAEMLLVAGFEEPEESAEGKSNVYAETVPDFEPGDAKGLPHSLFVEAFKPQSDRSSYDKGVSSRISADGRAQRSLQKTRLAG